MRRLSLAVVLLLACSALWSCKKDTATPLTTGTLQGIAQTAVGDTVLAGVQVSTSPATSSVSTDGQGHYSIPDTPGGEYAVTGTKAGFTPFTVSVSVVAGQTTNANLTMTRLARTTGSIRGQVRTSAGDTLMVGATVVTSPATSSVLTDTQGRYEMLNASPGQYIVTATKGGYNPGTINVSVVAGAATQADILMTRSGPTLGSIQGQVRSTVGDTLIVGAAITTAPLTASPTTDQRGQYTILNVPPGTYTVTATKTGYNPGYTSILVIPGQTTTADIRLTSILVSVSDWHGSSGLFPDQVCWRLTTSASPEVPVLTAGVLQLSTSPDNEWMWYEQDDTDLVIPDIWVIEARLRVISESHDSSANRGVCIQFAPAANHGNVLMFEQDRIFLMGSYGVQGPTFDVSTDDAFHTYRIEVVNRSAIRVYYDGNLVLEGSIFESSMWVNWSRIVWGDGTGNAEAVSQWVYFVHNGHETGCPGAGNGR